MEKTRQKLIEVAFPVSAVNAESAREKFIRHGHPSTLHLWWARRPLAACRAILFASLVDDPDSEPMYAADEELAAAKRAELFNLIEELAKWENTANTTVQNKARAEIARCIASRKLESKELSKNDPVAGAATPWDFKHLLARPEDVNVFLREHGPRILDPFAGGGSIPLEAQRLGLRAFASDLNPIPVLITKALIDFPPRLASHEPINPVSRADTLAGMHGTTALAEDVRHYGRWMNEQAEARIGSCYPSVEVSEEMVSNQPELEPYLGQQLTPIGWIWARTVASPNPAADNRHVPLMRSYRLCNKPNKKVWLEPIIDQNSLSYRFEIRRGHGEPKPGTVSRAGGVCLLTGTPIPLDHIRSEGKKRQLGEKLVAIVAEGDRERVYLPATTMQEQIAKEASPTALPDTDLPTQALGFRVQNYGMTKHSHLFSTRQLTALTAFTDLIPEVREQAIKDSGGDELYANAIATYLSFAVGRSADKWATLTVWNSVGEKIEHVFGRNALSMTWDFPECNPFSSSTGNWESAVEWVAKAIELLPAEPDNVGEVHQRPAQEIGDNGQFVYSTDPPYYDNVPYADLSDFFYVWLRRCLHQVHPQILSTLLVPKSEELVAEPFRHGGRDKARSFFEEGMTEVLMRIRQTHDPEFPATIFYAFKQTEDDNSNGSNSRASTGWETFLNSLVQNERQVVGTIPLRTERPGRLRDQGSNALASSIVLLCRSRKNDASTVTRRDFASALKDELPEAIKHLQSGNVAPVDLAQASIGPGMAVFSRYKRVVNADGSPMSVRQALQMINQVLDEALHEQEADFDAETRFAVRWFQQYGMTEGPFGDAETLAKAMAVAVSGVVQAGILASKAGKVRLLKRDELDANWNPATDRRSTIWECTQYLIRHLQSHGESAAAQLLAEIQQAKGSEAGEVARELSYRLYSTCERKSWAEEARSYNGLVVSWPEIVKLARGMKDRAAQPQQQEMF